MRTRNLTLLVLAAALLALLGLGSGPVAAEGHEDVEAPPKEALKKLFPAAESFKSQDMGLEDESAAALRKKIAAKAGSGLEEKDEMSLAYIAVSKGKSVGAAWMTWAHLKGGDAGVVVGLDLTGKIVGVVLVHNPVAALSDASYLKQYVGKTADSSLQVGKDLKAAPKQEEASKKLAASVKRAATVLTLGLLKKG